MPRVTRAKAHAIAEEMHIDEDEVLAMKSDPATENPGTPEPSGSQRAALGELAPNSAGSKDGLDGNEALKGEGKTRKGGRKGKGKKEDLGASTMTQPKEIEDLAAGEAMDGVTQQETEMFTPSMDDLAIATEDLSLGAARPGSPVASATPKVIQQLRKDTPGKRSTSNKENVEPGNTAQSPALAPMAPVVEQSGPMETTPVQAATPLAAQTHIETPVRLPQENFDSLPTDSSVIIQQQSPIEALDELDEAVQKVTKEIPEVQASPEKKRKISVERKPTAASKPAAIVRTTRASQARLSIAQADKGNADKGPSLGRPRPPTTIDRTSSVRQSTAPTTNLGRSSSVRQSAVQLSVADKRVTSTSSNISNFRSSRIGSEAPRERREVVIPHSKPRPISLSFPTPPPPPKSKKPATKSTFQLPGEAVAARLKAAREERLKQDAGSGERSARSVSGTTDTRTERKPTFKARPVPDMLKKTPSVRHTAASRARESIAGGTMLPPSTSGGLKRSSTTTGARQRPMSMHQAPVGLQISKRPTPRPSTAAESAQDSKRITSTISVVGGKSVNKGKEVFDRVANAKASAEKDKKEKEENAKRARAEAAERSRQMSREWAEKRKAKKAALPASAAVVEAPAAAA
nr:hypothetical protein B0A51_01957 [Rachicladosporium sp. CCFEE 5018]